MKRMFSIAILLACCGSLPAVAQPASNKDKIAGMQLTTLQGGFQYTDPSTKNVLHGYIDATTLGRSPSDVVAFRVCNTNTTLHLAREQLHNGPPCRKTGPVPWVAWKLEGSKLVAGAGTGATSLWINELPGMFQSILNRNNPYEVRAFSLPSPSGATTLGVITKPNG
jgi:hypothetical protein